MFDFKIKLKVQKVNFGEEQVQALSKLEEFTTSSDTTITLSGSAGTGKTSLIIEYLEYLDDQKVPYTLAAPTHKAKLVMEALTGQEATTIHQLLALQPNLDIFELDFRELDFFSGDSIKKPNQIPYKGVVIVDEASMVSDELFSFILNKARKNKSKVVWVGDEKQLQPVKSDTLSKVFSLSNKISLTKIYRQKEDSPVLDILSELRDHSLSNIEPCKGVEDSIYTFNSAMDFLRSSKSILQETVESENVLNAKILAFTNNRVNTYNKASRKLIFGQEGLEREFNKGEILTGYDNFSYAEKPFYNSLDYIIKNTPEEITKSIIYSNIPLNGYYLNLFDTVYRTTNTVFVLSKNNDPDNLNNLSKEIEQTRLQALMLKKRGRSSRLLWNKYYAMINDFATTFDMWFDNRVIKRKTFDYGYALTVHKS